MRKEYEMTDEQKARIIEAGKPIPVLFMSGGVPMGVGQQENANNAWKQLGRELGFDYLTVVPISGKSDKFFTAEATQ